MKCKTFLSNSIYFEGHTGFVNSCDSARRGPQMITSASDDCTIKVWDPRKRGGDAVTTFNNNYQVMSVCFNDTADQVITGGLDNEIKVIYYLYNIVFILNFNRQQCGHYYSNIV